MAPDFSNVESCTKKQVKFNRTSQTYEKKRSLMIIAIQAIHDFPKIQRPAKAGYVHFRLCFPIVGSLTNNVGTLLAAPTCDAMRKFNENME